MLGLRRLAAGFEEEGRMTFSNGRGTLVLAEHPREIYVCVSADAAGTSMFLTLDQAEEIGLAMYRMARRKKRRVGKV